MWVKSTHKAVRENIARARARAAAHTPRSGGVAPPLLNLQQTHGNHLVQRLVNGTVIQRKCACGGTCGECRAESAQRERDMVRHILRRKGSGQPLDPAVRAFMETRFGEDFSKVRVHTDTNAALNARRLNAVAFTAGEDIFFGRGQYYPQTQEGKRLLSHELTHVVQQSGGLLRSKLTINQPGDSYEQEANRGADAVMRVSEGHFPQISVQKSFAPDLPTVQRQEQPELPREPQGPPTPETCAGKQDITEEFRAFVTDVPNLLARAQGLNEEERARLTVIANRELRSEGSADIDKYTVVSCGDITSELSFTEEEKVGAYIDESKKELGFSTAVVDRMREFRTSQNREALVEVLQTVAHEKRHVTLGSAAAVSPAGLRPGFGPSDEAQASYRVEEILARAEEIAVGREALEGSYLVPVEMQPQLRRHWGIVRSRVSDAEALRLRGVIIDRLQERFGSTGECANAITVGVVKAMEEGIWYRCDEGRVVRPPAGLNLCEIAGRHPICGPET